MNQLKYNEIIKANRELGEAVGGQPYRIRCLSNLMTAQLKEILEFSLRQTGTNAHVESGTYHNIVQESEASGSANLVVVFWELANIVEGLHYKIDAMDSDEVRSLSESVKAEIQLVCDGLSASPLVLFNRFSSATFNYRNLKSTRLDALCAELNDFTEKFIPGNFTLIDIDKVFARISIPRSVDFRYFYSAKALYTVEFYKAYVELVKPVILAVLGKAKKALIFDCDNTLWKGILGEDGIEGIEMSARSKDGAIFDEVQTIALELNRRGILLGLCSKNNEVDVNEVLAGHEDMRIREEHLVAKRINWQDKVQNLREIAQELTIGLDSLVMVDDSSFEVNFIREALPEVEVFQVPERLSDYPQLLRDHLSLFYTIAETKEDLQKAVMYKQERRRQETWRKIANLDDYLASLELKAVIRMDESNHIPRLAQMTQKTNQFNLTTKRYTEGEIEKFIGSGEYWVIDLSVADRFGDYGLTGLCIVRAGPGEGEAEIDTLLMSCRIIGRRIEFAFVNQIIDRLRREGLRGLRGRYAKTRKNEQVACLFDQIGFDLIATTEDTREYRLDLEGFSPREVDSIQIEQEE